MRVVRCSPSSELPRKCEDDDGDECDKIRAQEEQDCVDLYSGGGYGHWIFRGCMERARYRHGLCKKNSGTMPSDAPPPWSDADVDGWPTIHDR